MKRTILGFVLISSMLAFSTLASAKLDPGTGLGAAATGLKGHRTIVGRLVDFYGSLPPGVPVGP